MKFHVCHIRPQTTGGLRTYYYNKGGAISYEEALSLR
jgi:hypothetical protein